MSASPRRHDQRWLPPALARHRVAAPRLIRPTVAWPIAFALALVAGCATVSKPPEVSERVILLPQRDGSPSAVEVSVGTQRLQLDKPYAVAERQGTELRPASTDAAAVQQRYGAVLAAQPAPPQHFVVQFEANGSRLTAAAAAVLDQLRAALAGRPGADLVVTGHTDRVGSVEANDRLSLQRAQTVRDMLVAAGVPREAISVAGRGEREPAVATADEVAEARNRRVEIKLR